jgi:hypothetical protein
MYKGCEELQIDTWPCGSGYTNPCMSITKRPSVSWGHSKPRVACNNTPSGRRARLATFDTRTSDQTHGGRYGRETATLYCRNRNLTNLTFHLQTK